MSEQHLVPKGYTGDLAQIKDTFERRRANKLHFYYVSSVDGKAVPNAASKSEATARSAGQLHATGFSRDVRSEQLQLSLRARAVHSTLLVDLLTLGGNDDLQGTISFHPKPGRSYRVRGKLTASYSAVWLEDEAGVVVSELIEKYPEETSSVKTQRAAVLEGNPTSPEQAAIAGSKRSLFLHMPAGESDAYVLEQFGTPDSVIKDPGNPFAQRLATETHSYGGLGKIRYSYGRKGALFVEAVEPLPATRGVTAAALAHHLRTDNFLTLIALMEAYQRVGVSKPNLLAVFASKLEADFLTKDKFLAKGLAYICRILGEGSPGTYDALLARVAAQANYRGLKRHARASLSTS